MELKIRTMILKSINDTNNISVITLMVIGPLHLRATQNKVKKNVEHSNCLAIVLDTFFNMQESP